MFCCFLLGGVSSLAPRGLPPLSPVAFGSLGFPLCGQVTTLRLQVGYVCSCNEAMGGAILKVSSARLVLLSPMCLLKLHARPGPCSGGGGGPSGPPTLGPVKPRGLSGPCLTPLPEVSGLSIRRFQALTSERTVSRLASHGQPTLIQRQTCH